MQMRLIASLVFVTIFGTAILFSANPEQQTRQQNGFTLDACKAWYAARHFDWDNPINPSSMDMLVEAMCPHFHKAVVAALYEDTALIPYQLEIDPLESCNKQVNAFTPKVDNERFKSLAGNCMRRHQAERYLHTECVRDGLSFLENGPYLWCRIYIAASNREPWESLEEIRQQQKKANIARDRDLSELLYWVEEVSKTEPKFSCPEEAHLVNYDLCTVSFAAPPYPVKFGRVGEER